MDFISIVFFSILGIFVGTLTGLVPGIHPNTIAVLFMGFVFADPFLISILIISAAVTHSFLSFIPSIFLGAPDPATALSVLPGHKMLMEGRGYEAVKLTVIGGLISLLTILALFPLVSSTVPTFYGFIRPHIHWILIAVVLYMFLKDKKFWGLIIFSLAGILGYLVLNGHFLGNFALFPLLTGLFGISTLVNSIKEKKTIPEQNQNIETVSRNEIATGGLVGSFGGILVGLLPGIGAAQATFLSQEVLRDKTERKFLISIGGVNTADAVFSLLALWLIGNPRSGAAVAVGELLSTITFSDILIFVGVVSIVSGIAGFLTLVLSKKCLGLFRKINYQLLGLTVIGFLFLMIYLLTGFLGILIATLSTLIGLVCILSGTRRSYLMACLILPTILFFMGV